MTVIPLNRTPKKDKFNCFALIYKCFIIDFPTPKTV